jgi:hypothetical protein
MSKKANYFGARIAANKLIEKYSISNSKQINIEDIAMAEGAFVQEGPLDGSEARLLRGGGSAHIRIKEDIRERGKKRFAIAHELGHWLLHNNLSQWNLCTTSDLQEMQEYKGSPLEVESNAFASALLLPTTLLRLRCEDAVPDLTLIQALAEEFDTTLTATAIRFVEECKEICAVIFSENGRVKWWKGRDERPSFWIEPGKLVHKYSSCWECFNDAFRPLHKMESVDPNIWLDSLPSDMQIDLYEQSIKLGQYPSVITLLWIVENED